MGIAVQLDKQDAHAAVRAKAVQWHGRHVVLFQVHPPDTLWQGWQRFDVVLPCRAVCFISIVSLTLCFVVVEHGHKHNAESIHPPHVIQRLELVLVEVPAQRLWLCCCGHCFHKKVCVLSQTGLPAFYTWRVPQELELARCLLRSIQRDCSRLERTGRP